MAWMHRESCTFKTFQFFCFLASTCFLSCLFECPCVYVVEFLWLSSWIAKLCLDKLSLSHTQRNTHTHNFVLLSLWANLNLILTPTWVGVVRITQNVLTSQKCPLFASRMFILELSMSNVQNTHTHKHTFARKQTHKDKNLLWRRKNIHIQMCMRHSFSCELLWEQKNNPLTSSGFTEWSCIRASCTNFICL